MSNLERDIEDLVKQYSVRDILETLGAVLEWKAKGYLDE